MHLKKKRRIKQRLVRLIVSLVAGFILTYFVWFLQSRDVLLPKEGAPAIILSTETDANVRESLLKAIGEAKKSVLVLIYSLSDKTIIHALNQKAVEGLDVKVICDANASRYAEQQLSPKINLIKRYGKGLMHLKIIVLDQHQTWIGSANLTRDSLTMNSNLIIAMESPELATFVTEKAATMGYIENTTFFSHRAFTIGGQRLELWFLPDDAEASLRLKNLIRSVRSTIRIAMFAWTRYDLANTVADAKKRGVSVEVAMDNNQRNSTNSKVPEILLEAGIPACVNRGRNLLHHKFMYIDRKTLVNGSANWTKKAFSVNDDCFVVLHDLTEKQQEQMDLVWKTIQKTGCTK